MSSPGDDRHAASAALSEVYAFLRQLGRRHAATDHVAASNDERAKESAPRTSRGADVEIPTQATSGVDPVDSIAYAVTSDASDRALGAQSRPGLTGQFDVPAEVVR